MAKTEKTEAVTFEDALEKLRGAVEAIRSEGVSLEDAIRHYENGVGYYSQCQKILGNARQKIELFDRETGEIGLFDIPEGDDWI